jgi:hypothetical protein
MTNREIGAIFGSVSYSAMAKANESFLTRLKENRTLRKKVQQLSRILSNVKG